MYAAAAIVRSRHRKGGVIPHFSAHWPSENSGESFTRLPNSKKICARPNTAKVNIDPQGGHVIVQLRHTRRAQYLVTRFCGGTEVVGSFFAPYRQVQTQLLAIDSVCGRRKTRAVVSNASYSGERRGHSKGQGYSRQCILLGNLR